MWRRCSRCNGTHGRQTGRAGIERGYTIVQEKEEEVLELTLEEIALKFGRDVKNIKVKK